jgi:ATP-binding cassette subfamily B (MDR/TAP) protein 1
MMSVQSATGGFPVKELDSLAGAEQFESILGALTSLESKARPFSLVQDSFVLPANRPVTFGNWMFDAVADLAAKDVSPSEPAADHARFSAVTEMTEYSSRSRRPSSIQILAALPPPPSAETAQSRRYSLQFTPTSPVFPHHQLDYPREFFQDKALQDSGERASSRRRANLPRARWDDSKIAAPALTVEMSSNPSQSTQGSSQSLSFWQLLKTLYPTVPHKPLICLGLILCIMSGAMTPVFSFLLARLIFEVSIGAHHISLINTFGGLVLGAAAFDGFLMGMKYFLMESTAMLWVTRIRKASYRSVLLQDRKWFDKSENSPVRLVQILVKDGDDARNLISVVLGQALVVIAMLSVGLIWAMVRGWQLTLVGFAIGPVFAATMAVQSRLVAQCELKNKRAREEVAKNYYEVCLYASCLTRNSPLLLRLSQTSEEFAR